VSLDDTFEIMRDGLADRFHLQREIGRGGMARVFLATEHKTSREVAIKVLNASVSSAIGRKRFLREVRLVANLNHPNIVPILSAGEESGLLYYVMPYISSETVRHRLVRREVVPVPEALQIIAEAAGALSHAHSTGVVHRDVKPENILLSNGHAMMADFGVARAISEANNESLTKAGIAVGTPLYMSPEQAAGKPVDARTDVYALGCVLHELLLGRVPDGPLDGEPQDPDVNVLPENVQRVLRDALAGQPDKRFENGAAFARALKREMFALGGRHDWHETKSLGQSWRPLALGGLVVALTAMVGARLLMTDRRAVVQVMAFEDVGRPTIEDFGRGLREAIVARLAGQSSIRAVPMDVDEHADAARGGDVSANGFTLRGRVRWELGASVPELRITAILSRTGDGAIVWTDQYDVRLSNSVTTQTEVAERIARGVLDRKVMR
jgi:eukaryotic-like serine/threonine-protein kinase